MRGGKGSEVYNSLANLCPECMCRFLHYILGKQHIKYPGVHLEDFIKTGKKGQIGASRLFKQVDRGSSDRLGNTQRDSISQVWGGE